MSNLAINDAGEVLAFDGKEWKPAPVAANDKGQRTAFDGKEWRPLDAKPEGGTFSNVAEKVNTGVNWLGTQLTKGATGVLGAPSALGELGRQGAGYLGEKVGVPEAGRAACAVFNNMLTFGG